LPQEPQLALSAASSLLGRNRESKSRDELAGRRNWPEAAPWKMSGRKRSDLTELRTNCCEEATDSTDVIGATLENQFLVRSRAQFM